MKYLDLTISVVAICSIILHLILRFALAVSVTAAILPLYLVLTIGGGILVFRLLMGLLRKEFGADLLAGISIVTSLLLDEPLAGTLVVLMLSGGSALEALALRRASSVLEALAQRMPTLAHRRNSQGTEEIPVDKIAVGDELVILPHEICPVDGVVLEGRSSMDESFLTGEPYRISKTVGTEVISGAMNGPGMLVIRALRLTRDSRYSRIMQVMDTSRQHQSQSRRIGDLLGTLYTPCSIAIALFFWWSSGDPERFLAVLVVATPCPLIIAIPVAIIGAISWSARRGIIIRDPAVLEKSNTCTVLITDKTGTLTVGKPELVSIEARDFDETFALQLAASLEQYSKHPLAESILSAARAKRVLLFNPDNVNESPGQGLSGIINHKHVAINGRKSIAPELLKDFTPASIGLECIVLVDHLPRAILRFRDEPRADSKPFVDHLSPKHHITRTILLSGDRDREVQDIAQRLGISEVHSGKSPEEKLEIVEQETRNARTIYLGDGINDAPALMAATVGIAMGARSDITSEASGATILEPSMRRVDQFLHISAHLRKVLLQSAIGGMAASLIAMGFAGTGFLTPVMGALTQELIDLFAVLNALRTTMLLDRNSYDATK